MTSRRKTESNEATTSLSIFTDILQTPTANSFLASQRFALEAAKFWARRMRAYADQMEEFANCRSPDEIASAQTHFLERMREDYAAESEAFGQLLSSVTPTNGEARRQPDA
jgi:hypothetical protein